jgi:hypothetical protein
MRYCQVTKLDFSYFKTEYMAFKTSATPLLTIGLNEILKVQRVEVPVLVTLPVEDIFNRF